MKSGTVRRKGMKKTAVILTFIICLPLIGTLFIKPAQDRHEEIKTDMSVIDQSFRIVVHEDIGDFRYSPEEFTGLLMYRVIPKDIVFGSSEEYIDGGDTMVEPEKEYLKALSIVCRSNIVAVWEMCGCPDVLDFDKMNMDMKQFYKIYHRSVSGSAEDIRLKEVKRAVTATYGAVITKEDQVITAPFFTTPRAALFVGEAGDGYGFSLNYAYEMAKKGMDFYELLKYFFQDIKVTIYE